MTASLHVSARSAALVPSPISLPEAGAPCCGAPGNLQRPTCRPRARHQAVDSRLHCPIPASCTSPAAVLVPNCCRAWWVGSSRCQPGRPPSLLGVTAQLLLHRSGTAIQIPSLHRISAPASAARKPALASGLLLGACFWRYSSGTGAHSARGCMRQVNPRPLHINQHAHLIGKQECRDCSGERWLPLPSYHTLFSQDDGKVHYAGLAAVCSLRQVLQAKALSAAEGHGEQRRAARAHVYWLLVQAQQSEKVPPQGVDT